MSNVTKLHPTPKPVAGDPDWRSKEDKRVREERLDQTRKLKVDLAYRSRHDLLAAIKNKGYTFEQIEKAGGPKAQTLLRWQEDQVEFQRNETMLHAANVCGIRQTWQ